MEVLLHSSQADIQTKINLFHRESTKILFLYLLISYSCAFLIRILTDPTVRWWFNAPTTPLPFESGSRCALHGGIIKR